MSHSQPSPPESIVARTRSLMRGEPLARRIAGRPEDRQIADILVQDAPARRPTVPSAALSHASTISITTAVALLVGAVLKHFFLPGASGEVIGAAALIVGLGLSRGTRWLINQLLAPIAGDAARLARRNYRLSQIDEAFKAGLLSVEEVTAEKRRVLLEWLRDESDSF